MLSGMLAALSACEEAAAPEHEAREAAAESTVQAVRSALVNGGTWIPLGPAPISTGIGYDADFSSISHTGGQTSTGPAAGRAVVIAVNPLNPQDVFLGTAGGGLWNSRDSSTWPWRPLTDSAPSLAIGALALADCSADRCDTVYVGTGERNMRRQTQYGAGLFVGKFSAGGEFPINDYVFSEVPGSSAAFRFGAITGIVRSSATLIYAAVSLNNSVTSAHANVRAPTPTAGYGVHRWNGSAWSRVLSTPTTSATNWADVRVPTDLEADPVNPGGLIAGFSAEGLFRSAPGDDTNWCAMNPGATLSTRTCVGSGLPAAGTFDHVELATLPGSSTMYAMFGNCPSSTVPDHQGATLDPCVSPIFRTDNGGASWLQVQSGTVPTSGVPREGYSRYTHALKIHPSNAQTVYYSGLKPWRSTNGGVTWTQLTPAQLHGDQQDIVIIPGAGAAGADLLYSASDGGFFFSTDGGLTSWTSGNDNLLISQVHGLGIDLVDENLSDEFPASTAVIAGLQDNATAVFNGGRSWQSVNGGDGGEAVIQTPTINYTCAQRDAVRRTNGTRASGAAGKKVGTTKDFSLMPIYTQHEASKRVFHATDVVSFVAGDDASWAAGTSPTPVQLSPVFDETAGVHPAIETDRNIISSLGVAPSVAFRLYAGMYEGQLWRTTSATGTQPCATKTGTQPDCWARADNGLPTGWPISSVAVHPSDPNTLWLTISGFHVQTVWFSSNAGQTWTARSGGLPTDEPAKVIKIDPRDPTSQTLYLGTDHGVWLTTDGGASWSAFTYQSNRLPNAAVLDIEIDAARNRVFAGTHGRGVWMLTTSPKLITFEGWTDDGIWDIPVYGDGFSCNSSTSCSCTVEVLRQDGSSCAPPSNVDARGSHVRIPAGGSQLSTDDQQTTCGDACNGQPVIWACFNGKCAGNTTLAACNQPNNRVSSVRVKCANDPVVQAAIAGSAPQQAQPPSDLFEILPNGTGQAPLTLAAITQTLTITPTITSTPANGGDRALCSAEMQFSTTEARDVLQERMRDAINSDPDCRAASVRAELLENAPVEDFDEDQAAGDEDLRMTLVASANVGAQVLTGMSINPGTTGPVCFRSSNLGVFTASQLAMGTLHFSTAARGAAGGRMLITEESPLGRCTLAVTTVAGQTPLQLAAAVAATFQAPGVSDPQRCPAFQNPHDLSQDGSSVVSVLATSLTYCIDDPGIGVGFGPHGVDICSALIDAPDQTINRCIPAPVEETVSAKTAACAAPGTQLTGSVLTINGKAPTTPITLTGNNPRLTLPVGVTVIRWTAASAGTPPTTRDQRITVVQSTTAAACCGPQQTLVNGTANPDILLYPLLGQYCIFGQAGADTIATGLGADLLSGDDGNDTLTSGAAGDVLIGGAGNDVMTLPIGNGAAYGGPGNDYIEVTGTATVFGNAGDDHIVGVAGTLSIYPGPGSRFSARRLGQRHHLHLRRVRATGAGDHQRRPGLRHARDPARCAAALESRRDRDGHRALGDQQCERTSFRVQVRSNMTKKSIISISLTIGLAISAAAAQDAMDASRSITATLQDDEQLVSAESVDSQRQYYQARLAAARDALSILQASPGQVADPGRGGRSQEERARESDVEQQLRRQIRDQRRIITDSQTALRKLGQ